MSPVFWSNNVFVWGVGDAVDAAQLSGRFEESGGCLSNTVLYVLTMVIISVASALGQLVFMSGKY